MTTHSDWPRERCPQDATTASGAAARRSRSGPTRRLSLPALAALLTVAAACREPTAPGSARWPSGADWLPPPGVTAMLWGSSAESSINPAALFTINEVTGAATLVGLANVPQGSNRISAVAFDPVTGVLYGIKGGACHGAILITLNPSTGAGTIVDTLMGGWFNGTPGPNCPGGSDAIAFAPDGTLYANGWYGGIPQGKIMKVDKETATVLEVHPTPLGYGDWHGRRAHISGLAFDRRGTLWASRGASALPGQINKIDPATGAITATLYLTDPGGAPEDSITISDLTFAPDGKLYASLAYENLLATIDTTTGVVTRIGNFGVLVNRISGLTSLPLPMGNLLGRYWMNEAESGQGPTTVFDDQPSPVNLAITYVADMHWTLTNGHRGLRSDGFNGRGIVRGNAVGTKYTTTLDGARAATFVAVASWTDPPYVQRVAGFQAASGTRVAMMQTGSNGYPSMQFRTRTQSAIDIRWILNYDDDVRRVYHIVYDSQNAVANRRIRLYVNGVDQGPGTVFTGNYPALNEQLDFSPAGLEVELMNVVGTPSKALGGTLFYYAVYGIVLSDAEIAGNAAALALDDDNL
jgi:hypothetical protein